MAARYVTDTTVWRLVVPLAAPLDLTGSRLTAVFRPTFGGDPVAAVSTDDGSITLATDPATGKVRALKIAVSVAARNGWRVQSNTALAFDVHRVAAPGAEPEWPGRQFVTVAPGTDSDRAGAGFGPVFTQAQPYDGPDGLMLPALTTGPQGERGEPGASAITPRIYPIVAAASLAATHGLSYAPEAWVVTPDGEVIETDIRHALGVTTVIFPSPFTGTLYLR